MGICRVYRVVAVRVAKGAVSRPTGIDAGFRQKTSVRTMRQKGFVLMPVSEIAQGARPVARAYGFMVVATLLLLPAIDACAKTLSATIPVGQVTAARFVFQVIFLFPVLLWIGGRPAWRPGRAGWHALRGLLLALVAFLLFAALKVMPIADVIAIFFIEPLVLTVLCVVFLREPLGWRRCLAVLVGFGGSLLIIQPGFAEVGWHALLPVGAAFSFAGYLVITRVRAQGEDPVAMQCYSGAFSALFLLAALAAGSYAGIEFLTPVRATAMEWSLMIAMGAFGTVGHLLVVYAFRYAEGVALAPIQYLEIIGATFFGLLLFGDFPESTTWLGITIIVGSGLFVYQREKRVRPVPTVA